MKPANIIKGEAFPKDWEVTPTPEGGCIIKSPVATYEFSHFEDAVLYRDFITTRSKSVDRDKRGAAG
ncbi:MAG: hypothetical protein KF723_22000 [Rhizobiaceae bacterium]|nr:hypothetical protein [Rhizobiaceae bacterium]